MDFDLRLLRSALALAEHRNFARAAKAIHVSQPTLSRSIKELEDRAGTRLFDRGPEGAEPTDAGLLFLTHARELMSRASDLGREMDLLKGIKKGELRIGSGTYPTHMYVSSAVARIVREHPDIHISVANDNWANLFPLLRQRELDVAVIDVTACENDPEIEVIKLLHHQGYLVLRAGHPLLKKMTARETADTWQYPFVTTARLPTHVFRGLIGLLVGRQKATTTSSKAVVSVECESLHMMKTIAMESDAVSLLPLNLVSDEISRGELIGMPCPEWMRTNFGIARLAHRSLSPLGETFVRSVQQADADLLAWEVKTHKRLFAKPATVSK